ncbi:DUF4878 domain-containing protein [Flavobacterium sp. DGU11]|uniref:DUF4878 domain-containing protein n=1 Tax=Flavobacterium arundinis TaxID=3139143 RepID=A0ABU9HU13_9FLAO
MRKLFAMLAIMSITLFVSCGKESGPEGVAKSFIEHTTKGEFEEAKKYCDETTGQMMGMAGGMMTPEQKAEAKKKDVKIDIISSEIKEDKAVVKYKVTAEGEDATEKTMDLKKVDGDWKVTMNKEGKK